MPEFQSSNSTFRVQIQLGYFPVLANAWLNYLFWPLSLIYWFDYYVISSYFYDVNSIYIIYKCNHKKPVWLQVELSDCGKRLRYWTTGWKVKSTAGPLSMSLNPQLLNYIDEIKSIQYPCILLLWKQTSAQSHKWKWSA